MSLPVQIPNARYMVAGSYIYKGDLIMSWGIIYYVPLQYLKSRGMSDEGALFGGVVGNLLAGKMESYTPNVDESIKLFDRPVMNWDLLWQSRPTDQHLQAVLDSYGVEELSFGLCGRPACAGTLPESRSQKSVIECAG